MDENDSEDGSIVDGTETGYNQNHYNKDIFYSWECVSFQRRNGTTLDLVIPNMSNLMALIHVVHNAVYEPEDTSFLGFYRILKFKMKVSYEAWMLRLKLKDLLERAVYITLIQLKMLSHFHL